MIWAYQIHFVVRFDLILKPYRPENSIDHHAAVMAGLFIVKAYVAGAGCLGMGVANGAHIHSQKFELGAHVSTGEGRFLITVQNGGQRPGHGVAGGHKAENLLLPERALANGMNMGIRRGAMIVDNDLHS